MSILEWDVVGERRFETGVDRGVLYLEDGSGVAWNGLTAVEERINDSSEPYFQDGIKYLDAEVPGEFGATLKAFTYPDEFEQCCELRYYNYGIYVDDQPPRRFHLSYRTRLGNDVDGTALGYQIHILYNLIAVPETVTFTTLTAQPVPTGFSWNLLTTPMAYEGFRSTSHIILDSTEIEPAILAELEGILYGTVASDPHILSIEEVADYLS